MGLDIASIASNTAEIAFDVLGETAHITYLPNAITAERLEQIDLPQGDNEAHSPFVTFLADIITEWDLTRGSKTIPLTPDEISKVPLPLLKAIYMEVMRDVADGEAGKASSGTSQPKDHLAKRRTGTRSSKQRTTSA